MDETFAGRLNDGDAVAEADSRQLDRIIKWIMLNLTDEQASRAFELVSGLSAEGQMRVMNRLPLTPFILVCPGTERGETFLRLPAGVVESIGSGKG